MSLSAQQALAVVQGTSGALDAFGAYRSASSARRTAQLDAALLDVQASDALNRGNTEAAIEQARGQKRAAGVRAQAAGSGFSVGVGTAADLEDAAEFMSLLDASAIRESGRREALGYSTQAEFRRAEADSINPWADAAGSLIGSASRVASYWYDRKAPKKGKA
jgi:hypothetical protein